ncbi:unnamed protein product, partial [Didymodactylos carnosus]
MKLIKKVSPLGLIVNGANSSKKGTKEATSTGEDAVEICKFQAIRSAAVLITTTIDETLAILDDTVEESKDFKRRVGYTRFDVKFVMKIGIKNRIKNLITLLKLKNEQTQITINTTTVDDQNIDSQNLYKLMLSLYSKTSSYANLSPKPFL